MGAHLLNHEQVSEQSLAVTNFKFFTPRRVEIVTSKYGNDTVS